MFIRKKKYPSGNVGVIVVEKVNGKMNEQGSHRQLVAQPRYEELADTLNAAFKQLDKSFLYE